MKEHATARGIREHILRNPGRLQEAMIEEEIPFVKIMRNLVFGTNRSVFSATIGREQENVEQWIPGKPLRRLNMRATVANYQPNNLMESLYINTYRDDRELVIHLLPDISLAMYPDSLLFGGCEPLSSPVAVSVVCQGLVRSIARDYDSKLLYRPWPAEYELPVPLDTKNRGVQPFLDCLGQPARPSAGLRDYLKVLLGKPIKHAVVVGIVHESLFDDPARDAALAELRSFCLLNDFICLVLCDDWEARLASAVGPLELRIGTQSVLVRNAETRRKAAALFEAERIQRFRALEAAGISVCPLQTGGTGWSRQIVDFFRNRLVLK